MSEGSSLGPSPRQNLIGGVLTVALGAFALLTALSYPMGSLLRMGPGFFPSAIAVLLIVLGLALIVAGLRSKQASSTITVTLRSVLMIGLGMVLFAVLLERAGLIPATFALVLVSSLAEPQWKPVRAGVLALAIIVLVYLIFIVVLQAPIAAVNL